MIYEPHLHHYLMTTRCYKCHLISCLIICIVFWSCVANMLSKIFPFNSTPDFNATFQYFSSDDLNLFNAASILHFPWSASSAHKPDIKVFIEKPQAVSEQYSCLRSVLAQRRNLNIPKFFSRLREIASNERISKMVSSEVFHRRLHKTCILLVWVKKIMYTTLFRSSDKCLSKMTPHVCFQVFLCLSFLFYFTETL